MEWQFTVPGPPVPWMRTQTNGRQRFTPKKQRDYQARIRFYAKAANVQLLDGPVELTVVACIERTRPWVRGSGDFDNYAKQAADALQLTAFADDCQVVHAMQTKVADMENPRLEVTLRGTPATHQVVLVKKKRRPKLKLAPAFIPGRST